MDLREAKLREIRARKTMSKKAKKDIYLVLTSLKHEY